MAKAKKPRVRQARAGNELSTSTIDMAAFEADLAELDNLIQYSALADKVSLDQRSEIDGKAGEWEVTWEIGEGKGRVRLDPELRAGLAALTNRALVIQAVRSANELESVYESGMAVDCTRKFLKAAKAQKGFRGWCDKNGLARASLYRDQKLALHFGADLTKFSGISERKIFRCMVEGKDSAWVLENRQALAKAKNEAEVTRICRGLPPPVAEPVEGSKTLEPRTKFSALKKGDFWVVRVAGLTEAEVNRLRDLNESFAGNQLVSNALDTEDKGKLIPDDGKTNLKKAVGDLAGRSVELYRLNGSESPEHVSTLEEGKIPLTSGTWRKLVKSHWSEGTSALYVKSPDEVTLWATRLEDGETKTYVQNLKAA